MDSPFGECERPKKKKTKGTKKARTDIEEKARIQNFKLKKSESKKRKPRARKPVADDSEVWTLPNPPPPTQEDGVLIRTINTA